MLTWLDIQDRISSGESSQVEFKSTIDLNKLGRAIAAFVNTDGGLAVLGVTDDGSIVGINKDPERISEQLTSFLQTGLSSPVQAELGRHEAPSGWVHWIRVPRQRGYEPVRHAGAVFVRRGRSSVEPSPAELAELYNAFGFIVTEERGVPGATMDQVDISAFADFLARQGLSLEAEPRNALADDLRARGVITEVGEIVCATVYGVLAFGKTPQAFPQTGNCFVQCVAYRGLDRADEVLQVADARGRLDEQVDRALGWLAGLPRQEHYDGINRRDTPLVPPAAAREVVVNAVAHRDYAIMGSKVLIEQFADRIEVTSPGRLPNGLTPASVVRGGNPRARNQSITNYLLAMGKMEQRGRGWPIVARAMREHNDTEPELHEDRESRWVRVTLRTTTPGRAAGPPARLVG